MASKNAAGWTDREEWLKQVERDGLIRMDCRPEVTFYLDAKGNLRTRKKRALKPLGSRKMGRRPRHS